MTYQQMNSYDGSIYGRGPLNDPYPTPNGTAGFWDDGGMQYPAPRQNFPTGTGNGAPVPSEPEPDYVFTPTELDIEGRPINTNREKDTSSDSAIEILPQSPPKRSGKKAKSSTVDSEDPQTISTSARILKLASPLLIFFLFALVYAALNFWVGATNMVISDYFYEGGEIPTQSMIIYAIVFTGLVFLVSSLINIPILQIDLLPG